MKRKVNLFTDEFRLQVVQEYLETDLSQNELKTKYGIRGNACISNWMRKFGLQEPNEHQKEILHAMSKENEKSSHEQELERKIKELEKLLEHEKLRTTALNTMIDIAERELKISIRKKSGGQTVTELRTKGIQIDMDTLCGLFGRSRQGYYQRIKYNYKSGVKSEILLQMVQREQS